MAVQAPHPSKTHLRSMTLDTNRHFKQGSTTGLIAQTYLPVAQFPTVVHLDLLKNNLIPDPYLGTNELDCLWINDADWSYKTTFKPPQGWDWGPALASTGPYLPIRLEIFTGRMDDIKILPKVHDALDKADIKVCANISGSEGKHVLVEAKAPTGGIGEKFEGNITVIKPELWWPHTHGVQPRYEFTVELLSSDKSSLHKITKPLSLRHFLRLRRQQHAFFSGGSNWIPGDFFLPRFTHPNSQDVDTNYRRWLTLAKSGHQNMIRVWGGGIVETDHFYNLCDELGLMVWQDLLFACGNYPAHDEFCELVREETIVQVSRVVHHPSLVLVCGDNEDVWLAGLRGWEYKEEEKTVEEWMKGNFQHRRTLERILPEALEVVGIKESIPFGGNGTNARDVGDMHIWDDLIGRFVSEFGFESPPNMRTINHMLPNPTTRQSQSLPFLAHDKGPGAERRATMYMGENFRFKMDPLEDYVYCAQLLQSEAIGFAVNTWRREFRGPGEENCSGALVWQLNDNWPGISWAIADYYLRPKPAFFTMKRALAPISISSGRIQKSKIAFWACSPLLTETSATLTFAAHNIESGEAVSISQSTEPASATIKPNRTAELVAVDVPFPSTTVVSALLHSQTGELLARCVSWPDPLKFVTFSKDPQVLITVKDGRGEVVVKCGKPVKGLVLQVPLEEGEDAAWGDDCIDLVPGEEVCVTVQGLARRRIEGRWLCDWEGKSGVDVVRV
ncbi:glycoside hydrolase [Choiromyces venosus 120613-1]|uniref:beta-mannosidase n=1 Tax=Choiromyces venosus 120613-1 TaxID=1336337 RepID=A0A3N4J552_9PEZI|nr:glycoside hydrolase [Choiromyces venosus 120613-1]